MPIINVVKPFTYAAGPNSKLRYEIGEYEVDDATAESWFVKAHLEGFADPPPTGGFNYAQAMLNTEQAVRRNQPAMVSNQPPAPLADDVVRVATRAGMVPEGSTYFAGKPQEDKPLPSADDTGPRISFLGASAPAKPSEPPPPATPVPQRGHRARHATGGDDAA